MDGNFSENKVEHEIIKRDKKEEIIRLSIQYSLVTQFTSFVAVEKREPGEDLSRRKENIPSLLELVAKENVDELPYMGNYSPPPNATQSFDPS